MKLLIYLWIINILFRMNEKVEYLFKVLVIGTVATGKTSIIRRIVHNSYTSNYKTTIGVDFNIKTIKYNEDTTVRLQLWDIAGQDRYAIMTRSYYKDAHSAIIVCDISRKMTIESVAKWIEKVRDCVTDIPIFILCNKHDMYNVTNIDMNIDEYLDDICRQYGCIGWLYTSALLSTHNIVECLQLLSSKMIINYNEKLKRDTDEYNLMMSQNQIIKLNKENEKENNCCY